MRLLLSLALLAACKPPIDEPIDTGADDTGAPDTDTDDTDDTDTGEPAVEVVLGERCPLLERVGEVAILGGGADAYLSARIFDRPDPWYGPPELQTSSCAFHRFSTTSCGTCDAGDVCGFEGECVPERRVYTDATLDVTVDGATQTFTADATTGEMYGTVGLPSDRYALTLTFAGQEVVVPELGLAQGLSDVAVTADGDSMAPGDLVGTWTPPSDGGRVGTLIAINHHAAGPTFTRCDVAADVGRFEADAAMLTPLAVVTGIEFQGLEHAQTAAAYTPLGCVDVRLGMQHYVGIDWADE